MREVKSEKDLRVSMGMWSDRPESIAVREEWFGYGVWIVCELMAVSLVAGLCWAVTGAVLF